MADGLESIEDGLVGCFGADRVLLEGVDVVAVHVDDVAAASADALLSSEWFERRKRQAEELADP